MLAARPAVHSLASVALALWLWVAPVRAADVPYVPTPWEVVDAMLKLAAVGPNDYLIDLGSGDGRIVITAAKRTGARGFGVDLDDNLVRTARRNAEREGVKDRTDFYARNLFDTDISKASVISMYLLNSVNLRLRPALFKLKPGTRIVSHDFDMGHWTPDEKLTIAVPEKSYGPPQSDIFLWVVPADFSGTWTWRLATSGIDQAYDAVLTQEFQKAQGAGRIADRQAAIGKLKIKGDAISFVMGAEIGGKATWREFAGRIDGDIITGSAVTIVEADSTERHGARVPWRAMRSARGKMRIDAALKPTRNNTVAATI